MNIHGMNKVKLTLNTRLSWRFAPKSLAITPLAGRMQDVYEEEHQATMPACLLFQVKLFPNLHFPWMHTATMHTCGITTTCFCLSMNIRTKPSHTVIMTGSFIYRASAQ
jgi:hypothetical protein